MTGTAEFNSSTLYRYAHALSPDNSMCDITKLRSVGTAAGQPAPLRRDIAAGDRISGRCTATLTVLTGWVGSMAISPDGAWLATAAPTNGEMDVWWVQRSRAPQRPPSPIAGPPYGPAMFTGIFNLLWATVTVLMIVRQGSIADA